MTNDKNQPRETFVELDSGEPAPRSRKTARVKVMDLLARRPYSEQEIRQKLNLGYDEFDIEDAIEHAREKGWLLPPEELSELAVAELRRKKKGQLFIDQFLEAKGLPPVAKNLDEDVRHATEWISKKLAPELAKRPQLDYELRSKVGALLSQRGFDEETIELALRRLQPHPT